MNYILFDHNRSQFLPFTHTRPIADIRCGIFTMRERWEHCLGQKTSTLTVGYLQAVFPFNTDEGDKIYISGSIFGSPALAEAINKLETGQKLVKDTIIIAARINASITIDTLETQLGALPEQQYNADVFYLNNIWNIFSHNDRTLRDDFALITKGRTSAPVPENVLVSEQENLFIEAGAKIYAGCIINAATGPVYIGKDTEIMEGAIIRGPFAIGEHAVVKMGAKIYSGTTIGPGCKVGGEVSNTVFFANSNKGHDGFVGNAVVGEWCNLGADTNCSNLKNNYDEVKIWDEEQHKSVKTGLTFCGLFMGDHSKCGINTMFNTGTVVGVSCNIFGGGFPEKFVPSFGWGGSDGVTTYDFNRAMDTARRVMQRRNKELSPEEMAMYQYIFDRTATQRELFANG
jgi:UDP-N-acetylglucosamine diphosphorylase/glucosamine-1-phosphate N-acetyltransferase